MNRGFLQSFAKKNGPRPNHVICVIVVDCVRGLQFLPKYHMLNRDLETANILLYKEQYCTKISNFGPVCNLNTQKYLVNIFIGTISNMSPERPQGSEYAYASEI